MSIILRVNKGSALTYDELDRNQAQFFYSSSIHNSGTRMRLHYTGSTALTTSGEDYSPRYETINFPAQGAIPSSTAAAGDVTEVQFNGGPVNGVDIFKADSTFKFDSVKKSLAIGSIHQERLSIGSIDSTHPAAISLTSNEAYGGAGSSAYINFRELTHLGGSPISSIGKISESSCDFYISQNNTINASNKEYGKIHNSIVGGQSGGGASISAIVGTFSYDNNVKSLGIGTTSPTRNLNVVGECGIGIGRGTTISLESFIAPIPSSIYGETDSNAQTTLIPQGSSTDGLLISSPAGNDGGNVVVNINTDNNKLEAFNVISTNAGTKENNTSTIFTARASGIVGINTYNPLTTGLTVAGNISGSGTLQVETVQTQSTYGDITPVGVTDTGLFKKSLGATTPVGGIILWSGAANAIPAGWNICDGTTVNGQATPNLVSRFVMGAASPTVSGSAVGTVGGSKDAVLITHTHPVNDPGHRHIINHKLDSSENGNFLTLQDTDDNNEGTWSSNTLDNGNLRSLSASTGISLEAEGDTTDRANKNLPPFYALCYIMYVGS